MPPPPLRPGEGDVRRRILLIVERYPGLHLREIQRTARTSATLAEYHLNVLESLGLITSSTGGGYRRFFPARAGPTILDSTDKEWLGLLRRPPILAIALQLLERPETPPAALAEALGLSLSTVLYQLNSMKDAGLVAREPTPSGGLRLADAGRVLELLRTYHPTPDLFSRVAEMWSSIFGAFEAPPPEAPTEGESEFADLPSALAESPHSVRLIYTKLRDGSLTGQELVASTGLARRTVYDALGRLKKLGLVREQGHLKDMRQTRYSLVDREPRTPS